MDVIVWIMRLLTLLFFGWFGISSSTVTPPAPVIVEVTPEGGTAMQRVDHVVESVEALLLESYPVQIHLRVAGYQPDGCTVPLQIDQQRNGNHVTVEIYRLLSPDTACPMMIVSYEDTVRLEGGFESGTYTIDVNGTTIEVTI